MIEGFPAYLTDGTSAAVQALGPESTSVNPRERPGSNLRSDRPRALGGPRKGLGGQQKWGSAHNTVFSPSYRKIEERANMDEGDVRAALWHQVRVSIWR